MPRTPRFPRSQLHRALDRTRRNIAKIAAPAAAEAGAHVLLSGILSRVPVDQGELRASVSLDPPWASADGSFVGADVSVSASHAAAVEYGTSSRPANPYMRPTADSDGPRALAVAAKVLRNKV